ncbi:MAG: glucose-6-phosphate isomerase, partial [Alcanivorax sp.]
MQTPTLLPQYPAFQKLQALAPEKSQLNITALLSNEPDRAQAYTAEAAGLHLDYSKHLVDDQVRATLLDLAQQADLTGRAQALLHGEPINNTEGRAALHSLLRATANSAQTEKLAEVVKVRSQMKSVADKLNSGLHPGYSGQPITDVVNIGIGGSDLGPRLVTEALRPFQGLTACHYVANVDPADLQNTLVQLNPATTLFIICSKSFRTEETLTNALAAREWLLMSGANDGDLNKHFLAITTNLSAAAQFGIPQENCLPLWDWVGGRYSVWSAVGLSCAIAVGWENFEAFLAGARVMDEHFVESPPERNLPMLMSLLEVWCTNGLGAGNH